VALTPHGVQAAPLYIPATVYPPGTHIAYRPVLTNAEMDCLWGFFCEGNVPLFHFQTQDQLHRVDGWAQFAGVQRRGRTSMAFEFYDHRPPTARQTAWASLARQMHLASKRGA
jgi:hypothetical protein